MEDPISVGIDCCAFSVGPFVKIMNETNFHHLSKKLLPIIDYILTFMYIEKISFAYIIIISNPNLWGHLHTVLTDTERGYTGSRVEFGNKVLFNDLQKLVHVMFG